MQRAEFETKLNRVCLHIYKEEHYEEDYQMPMLRQNRLDGILEVEGCEVDGKARYTYEISGLTSMKTMYENSCIKKQEIEAIINRILEVTEILQRYMLDPNCLALKPEYIFNKEGRWFFCYFPRMEEDLCQLFHELTEYFVKMLDYEDTEGIFLAYELHKATLQEHYDLELIMKEYKGRESERNKMIREKQKAVRSRNENKGDDRRKAGNERGSYKQADSMKYSGKNRGRTEELYRQQERVEPQYRKPERKKGGYEKIENTEYDYGRPESNGCNYGSEESAGCDYGSEESAGCDYGRLRSAGCDYGRAESVGDDYKRAESAECGYGGMEGVGDNCRRAESTGYHYGRAESVEYDYGTQENSGCSYSSRKGADSESRTKERTGCQYGNQESTEEGYAGHGNIFNVADEDECETETVYKRGETRDQKYTADTIREERTGGWWKSWRKAANGIRRKRWGSWDDLILETDGQEEESRL